MRDTTLKRPRIRWTDYGDFSIHYDKGVANIHNKVAPLKPVTRQEKEAELLNSYQYFLFRRAIFGLEVYSQEELRYISSQKKKRILGVHKHTMEVINLFKQRVLSARANKILGNLLFSSKDIKVFISMNEPDPEFQCDLPLNQLGIRRHHIISELVEKKCLPYNFWDLTVKDDPRMAKLRAPQQPLDRK